MTLGLLVAGLLAAQPPARPDRDSGDPLIELRNQVSELSRRDRVSPDARRALGRMKQDVEVLELARAKSEAQPTEAYLRELERHTASLRTLRLEPLGKEDFNTLIDIAADLRTKAEYATHGNATLRLQVSKAPVYHLALVENGKQLIAPDDALLKSWDVDTGQKTWQLFMGRHGHVSALTSAPEGRVLVGTPEGMIRFVSASTGKVSRDLKAGAKIDLLAAYLGGDKFVVGHDDGSLNLWVKAESPRPAPLLKDSDRGSPAAFSPDGKWLCVPTPKKGVTVLGTGTEREKRALAVSRGDVAVARFTPDGRHICAVTRDGDVTVWNWPAGTVVRSWEGKQPLIWDAAISPDGKYLACASGFRDAGGEVKLWDLARGEEFKTVRFSSAVNVVAFSPDGKRLVTAHYDGSSRVWKDWSQAWARDPFQPVPVEVRTLRKGAEEQGYEVFYSSKGHLKDPGPHPRLRTVSSPARGEVPAGWFYFWATNGTRSSPKRAFQIDARNSDPIDLVIE
jgi:WD40 repeat protein